MGALTRLGLAAIIVGSSSVAARESVIVDPTATSGVCPSTTAYIEEAMPRGNVMLVYDANAATVLEAAWRYGNSAAPPADSVIVVLVHRRDEVVVAAVKDNSVCASVVIPRPVWNDIERPLARPRQPRS